MSDPGIDESFAYQTSSPQSLRQAQSPPLHISDHDYNFSGHIYDETTDPAPSTDEEEHLMLSHEHDLLRPASTRVSSVSSFPSSVIHHTPTCEPPYTPSKSSFLYDEYRTSTPTYQPPRAHSTGFRHPSSVRALQMRDEFEFSELEDSIQHRRQDSRLSYFSYRTSGSAPTSPAKRMSRSNNSSPQKSTVKTKLRKEFPLVLLHCTLLPPALSLRASQLSDNVLEAIIPQPYRRRWKALQEKVVRNVEVKTRGVLIPHPRDEYELLEEKLLESLELERPRLRDGHFLAANGRNSATDSGFESASSSDRADDEDESPSLDACPDCGKCINCDTEADRKWEIKVYAANGLLRSDAWGAAWQEMEKVDVEVSVWMPESVRREVDTRIEVLLEQEKAEKKLRRRERKHADDERMREIYGSELPRAETVNQDRTQDEIDGLFEEEPKEVGASNARAHSTPRVLRQTYDTQAPESEQMGQLPTTVSKTDAPLQDMLANYLRLLAQDRRNIAIFLLSMLVLFYGMNQPEKQPKDLMVSKDVINNSVLPTSSTEITTSQTIATSTITVEATDTSTIIRTATSSFMIGEEVLETIWSDHKATSDINIPVETAVPASPVLNKMSESPELEQLGASQESEAVATMTDEDVPDQSFATGWNFSFACFEEELFPLDSQGTCAVPSGVLVAAADLEQCTALAVAS